MAQAGVYLYPKAVPAAYGVCAEAYNGTSVRWLAFVIMDANPSWSYDQAQAFVYTAIGVYCPPAARTILR